MKAKIFLVMIAACISYAMVAFRADAGEVGPVSTPFATAYNNGMKIIKFGATLHAVYMVFYNPGVSSSRIVYATSTDDGNNWISVVYLDGYPYEPSLAVDANGNPHICLIKDIALTNEPRHLVLHWWKDSAVWQEEIVNVINSATPQLFYKPAITTHGAPGGFQTVHIVWGDYDSNRAPEFNRIRYWNNVDRGVETVRCCGPGTHVFQNPSIALDQLNPGNPRVNVVFENSESSPPEIEHWQRIGIDIWQQKDPQVSRGDFLTGGGKTPSLTADANGNLHCIWKNPTNVALYHDLFTNCDGLEQWAKNCRASLDPLLVRLPSLGVDILEVPAIHRNAATWVEGIFSNAEFDIYYALYKGWGCNDSWTDVTQLTETQFPIEGFPHVFSTPINNFPGNCRLDFVYTKNIGVARTVEHEAVTVNCLPSCN